MSYLQNIWCALYFFYSSIFRQKYGVRITQPRIIYEILRYVYTYNLFSLWTENYRTFSYPYFRSICEKCTRLKNCWVYIVRKSSSKSLRANVHRWRRRWKRSSVNYSLNFYKFARKYAYTKRIIICRISEECIQIWKKFLLTNRNVNFLWYV